MKNFILCLLLLTVLLDCWAYGASVSTIQNKHRQAAKGRIVGGRVVPIPHSITYIVYIDSYDGVRSTISCGGSLISENFVLTAQHCVINQHSSELYFGVHDRSAYEPGSEVRRSNEEDYIIHENSDIALIKLHPPVKRSTTIEFVKLPNFSDVGKNYMGLQPRAYGWGAIESKNYTVSNVLRYVDIDVESCVECFENTICTSGKGGKGPCVGDSGGPLIDYGVQIGVVSAGDEECDGGGQTIYVAVNKHLDWIQKYSDATIWP